MSAYTVHKLTNPLVPGLKGVFYAVLNPSTPGEVVDLIREDSFEAAKCTPEGVADAFERAAGKMPYRQKPEGGWQIDFLQNGKTIPMHIPKGDNDEHFHKTFNDWLCWRTRIDLWLDRKPAVLTEAQKKQIVRIVHQVDENNRQPAYVMACS